MLLNLHTHIKSDSCLPEVINLSYKNAYQSNQTDFFSVGIHPWDADEQTEYQIVKIKKLTSDNRCILVGECGFDKYAKASFEKQLLVFEKQISLSEKIKKPLIIHCVGYFNELFEIKQRLNPQQLWIIHGFRGKPQLAKQILKNNCAISFGKSHNIESVKATPLDKLYVETDESNSKIEKIYSELARIKSCMPEDLFAGNQLIQSIIKHNSL